MPYEYLDHTADLGVRGIGRTPLEAFSAGAQAVVAAMADVDRVSGQLRLEQCCTAGDIPSLFVEWLNELLYQREVEGVLFCSAVAIRLEPDDLGWTLYGVAWGEPLDLDRHTIHAEIKAATYCGLDYRTVGDKHVIQCVVDI